MTHVLASLYIVGGCEPKSEYSHRKVKVYFKRVNRFNLNLVLIIKTEISKGWLYICSNLLIFQRYVFTANVVEKRVTKIETNKISTLFLKFFLMFFCRFAPFGYLYFSSFFHKWTRIGCRNRAWHGFICWPFPSSILGEIRTHNLWIVSRVC